MQELGLTDRQRRLPVAPLTYREASDLTNVPGISTCRNRLRSHAHLRWFRAYACSHMHVCVLRDLCACAGGSACTLPGVVCLPLTGLLWQSSGALCFLLRGLFSLQQDSINLRGEEVEEEEEGGVPANIFFFSALLTHTHKHSHRHMQNTSLSFKYCHAVAFPFLSLPLRRLFRRP